MSAHLTKSKYLQKQMLCSEPVLSGGRALKHAYEKSKTAAKSSSASQDGGPSASATASAPAKAKRSKAANTLLSGLKDIFFGDKAHWASSWAASRPQNFLFCDDKIHAASSWAASRPSTTKHLYFLKINLASIWAASRPKKIHILLYLGPLAVSRPKKQSVGFVLVGFASKKNSFLR